jgi:hypothetical protein
VADGGEHGVVAIAVPSFEEVSAQVAVVLEMSDDGLDG